MYTPSLFYLNTGIGRTSSQRVYSAHDLVALYITYTRFVICNLSAAEYATTDVTEIASLLGATPVSILGCQ